MFFHSLFRFLLGFILAPPMYCLFQLCSLFALSFSILGGVFFVAPLSCFITFFLFSFIFHHHILKTLESFSFNCFLFINISSKLLFIKHFFALFLVFLCLFVLCFFTQITLFKVYIILHIFSVSFV
jgi:hypothetical protein